MAASFRKTALASTVAPSTPALSPNEIWYVATVAGVRTLGLDELERELESGVLDVSTPVWIPGMAEWETLGSVASLEDGPPLNQGPGIPPCHDSGRVPRLVEVAPPEPSSVPSGPLSEAPTESDPSDPNHALWASISPRASRPVQSGIWRRVDLESPARDRSATTSARQLLFAAVVAGATLMLLLGLVATS